MNSKKIPFRWYINRFRMMSLKEILTMRLYRFLRDKLSKPGSKTPPILSLSIELLNDVYRYNFSKYFYGLQEKVIKEANKILDNKIKIFDKEISFGKNIDWNMDYVTGVKWPSTKLDYRNSKIGDPKDIWELNRHQFLPVLGKAYYLTGDKQYAKKAINLIESWIDQNPPFHGVNWVSGIELSLRQLSWLWTFKYISGSEYLNEKILKKIRESMYIQTNFISKNLSLYSSANNHLISELASMVVIGTSLKKDRWSKRAITLLEEQIDNQILLDGVGAEQSPSYQAHTMEYYILSALILKENGSFIPEKVLRGLNRGAIFLNSLIDGKGYLPSIGDDDSGEVLRLSSNYSNTKTLINLTAFLTGNMELLQNDIKKDEKTFWLLGPKIYSKLLNNRKKNKRYKKYAFPDGGYYILERVLNKKKVKIVFDCGPLGMRPMSGHGHADALSVLLYVDDIPVLIDPGTYTYYKDDFWRNYFRSTSAHNTIRIDRKNQSVFGGKFLAIKQGKSICLNWIFGQKVVGRFFYYERNKNKAVHDRTLIIDEENKALEIIDRIETKGEHFIEQFFHFDSLCSLVQCGNNRFKIKTPRGIVVIQLDKSLESKIYCGNEIIPLGWKSEVYGSKEKTSTLTAEKRMKKSEVFFTKVFF